MGLEGLPALPGPFMTGAAACGSFLLSHDPSQLVFYTRGAMIRSMCNHSWPLCTLGMGQAK